MQRIDLYGLIQQLQSNPPTPRTPRTPRTGDKKQKVIKPWTKSEDETLKKTVETYGMNNWMTVAQQFPGRKPKQCKERYLNHLDPNITRKPWTEEEDQIMLKYREIYGNKWSEIKNFLPGRTANQIKNRFFSHFAEKLSMEGKKVKMLNSVFVPSTTEFSVIEDSPRFY